MDIEQAVILDAAEILALQKSAYISEAIIYNDFNIPPLLQTMAEIEADFETQLFLKAVIDQRIIGSVRAFAKNGTCYIGRLIVQPDFQNQGIGRQLIRKIEAAFNNCERFELFTGAQSAKNICFYQKLGYQIFVTKKINDNLGLVYLEKVSTSHK